MTKAMKPLAVLGGILAAGPILLAQGPPRTENEEANIQTYTELLRQDVRKQKVAIIGQLMSLAPEQAAKFWPIYQDYEKELGKLGDEKVAGIKEFIQNYGTFTNEVASDLVKKTLDLEARRVELKRKTVDRLSKTLSPMLAGRFLQIENQLQFILDLQVSATLPIAE